MFLVSRLRNPLLRYCSAQSDWLNVTLVGIKWNHTSTNTDLQYFPPSKRIPKRFIQEIGHVIEKYSDKIEHYASVLKCRREVIERLARNDTRILSVYSIEHITNKLRLLMRHGYSAEEIASNPKTFFRSYSFLEKRLKEMEEVKKYKRLLSLTYVTDLEYDRKMKGYRKEAALMGKHTNRISYIAELLGCSEKEVLAIADAGYQNLLKRRISSLTSVVHFLQEHGLMLEEIRKNPGAIIASIHEARERLELVSEYGVLDKSKIVFIMTTYSKILYSVLPLWIENKEALGECKDRFEYIKMRLGITDEQLSFMVRKAPLIKFLYPRRLRLSFDVLLEKMELSPSNIVLRPVLLYYSADRLNKRWIVLQEAGIQKEQRIITELFLSEEIFTEKYEDFLHLVE